MPGYDIESQQRRFHPYRTAFDQGLRQASRAFRISNNARHAAVAGFAVDGMPYSKKKKAAYRITKKMSRKRKRGASKSNLVTQQKDISVKPKNRRLTGKKYKQFKFQQKVQNAINTHTVSHSLLESFTTLTATVPAGKSGTFQLVIDTDATTSATRDFRIGPYGDDGQGLRRLLGEMHGKVATSTAATTATTTVQKPFYPDFGDLICDLLGCSINIGIRNITSSYQFHVDIYECVNRANIDSASGETAYKCWIDQVSDTCVDPTDQQFGGTANTWTRTVVENSGATPYHCPMFNKYWKIVKKTRLNMQPGEVINYSAIGGHKRGFTVNSLLYDTTGQAFEKGMVKDFIIIFSPTFNDRSVETNLASIQMTKNYYFKTPQIPLVKNLSATYTY